MKSATGIFALRRHVVPGLAALFALSILAGLGCSENTSVDALALRGEEALRQRRYNLAARNFRQALRHSPVSNDLRYNLASAYWMMGDIDAAIEQLDRNLSHAPDDRPARLLKGHLMLRRNHWDEARKIFEQGVDIFGMDPEFLTALALVEIGAKRTDLARLYLRDALELHPEYPPALYNMGRILNDSQDHPTLALEYLNRFCQVTDSSEHLSKAFSAIERLRRSIPVSNSPPTEPQEKTTPDLVRPSPDVRSETGSAPSREHDEDLVAEDRQAERARELLERARHEMNNNSPLERVLSLLKRAVEANPGDPDAQWQLARVYDRQSLQTRAMQHYQKFRELFPDDPRIRDIPADYGYNAEQAEQRRREAREARRFAQLVSEARNHYNIRNWNAAIEAYRQAVEIRPESAETHYNLGFAHRAAGNASQAEKAYSRARELAPGDPRFAYALAMLLRELGQRDRAIEIMETVLRNHPDYAKGLLLMAYLRWDQKRYDEVRRHLSKYLAVSPPGEQHQKVQNWLRDIP